MNEWRTQIYCYWSVAGNNKIAEWYDALLAGEKADVDEFIKIMRRLEATEWKMPNYRRLRGMSGIGELRWSSGKKQHRLLGFFMNGIWYAVQGCTHKQQVYDPADALRTAMRNKGQIERSEVMITEYDF